MGRIEDEKLKRKDTNSDPLKEIGNRRENTNDVDINEKTIRKQKNKE